MTIDDIEAFIKKTTGKSCAHFDENTELEKDLRIWGDDAYEFLEEFSRVFDVDISNFAFSEYFREEGDSTLVIFLNFLTRQRVRRKSLQIKHLIKAAETNRLDESTITNLGVLTRETWI